MKGKHMQIKKTALVAVAASAIGLLSIAGIASAASPSTSLVDKLAQKFNLDKTQVQKVFDEDRASHQAEHEASYEARLAQAVKDGKITEAQKTKILAKHKELQTEMEKNRAGMEAEHQSMETKTDAERKVAMEQHRTEMDAKRAEIEAWEKANNIPSGYLMGGPGGMMHGGGHHGSGPGGPF